MHRFRWAVLAVGGLVLAALLLSQKQPGSPPPSEPGTTAQTTAAANATSVNPTAAATAGIVGFGATITDWNATHRVDPRFEAGTAYDPTPGLGPDEQHDDRYFGVLESGGQITGYEEQLPADTGADEAKADARAELPLDVHELWFAARDTCAQYELTSRNLAATGITDVLVELSTTQPDGSSAWDAAHVNDLLFLLGTYLKPADAPAC